jgi:hypothetical protein
MNTRARVVQRAPSMSLSLEGFPSRHHRGAVYRAARRAPWWFCTCGDCRFDLDGGAPAGLGTLYSGVDPITGVLETIGPEMSRPVTRAFLAERTIWMLAYDRPLDVADLCDDAAVGFGVTNELSSMTPYDVPQAWARVFAEAGWDGIAYRTRFSTGPHATGIALFDEAGAKDWVAVQYCRADDAEIVVALEERHITVDEIPPAAALTILA